MYLPVYQEVGRALASPACGYYNGDVTNWEIARNIGNMKPWIIAPHQVTNSSNKPKYHEPQTTNMTAFTVSKTIFRLS